MPARVDRGSFLRWSGWETRSRHRRETHLQQRVDLYGTREMISTRRSSVSLSAAVSLPLGGEEDDLHTEMETWSQGIV